MPCEKTSNRGGRKPARMNKDMLVKLREKKEKYKQRKQRGWTGKNMEMLSGYAEMRSGKLKKRRN